MTNDQLSPTLNGSLALINRIIALETAVTQLQARVTELEYLVSEELIVRIPTDQQREIVEDLGHAWRIERLWMPDPTHTQPIPAAADPSAHPDPSINAVAGL